MKVPGVQKFHGTKVLGLFAPRERMFHGSESSLYGLFAPGNESAEERKGLDSSTLPAFFRPDTMWTTRTPLITAVTQTRTTVINNTTCI